MWLMRQERLDEFINRAREPERVRERERERERGEGGREREGSKGVRGRE